MSYVVIARKYRPQLFSDVVGQEHITKTLKNAIKTNHLGQAYIFSGTRGVGKTTSARILAKAVNCEEGLNPEPCNKCESCISISEGRNIDVIEIDGASNRKIDDIREMRSNIKFKPMLSRFKVYIIDEVHMLTKESFNALLKTLEEPPPHVIFIFATTDLHKVPETILSRCQLFQFRKISSQEIFDALKMILEKEKIKFDVDALMEISKLGDGSMRDAESLLDQILAFSGDYLKIQDVRDVLGITPNSLFFELTDHIFCLRKKEAFDIIESIINQGYDLGLFIKDYVQFFRDLLIKKSISNNLSEEYIKLCKNISSNKIIQIIELLLNLLNEMKFSSYTSILLEMSIFKIFQMIESLNYDDLSNHLKKIELLFAKGSFSNNSKEENSLQNPVKKKTVDRLEELNIIKSSINDFSETLNVPLSEYLKKVSIKSVDNDKLQLEGKKIYIERLIEAGIDKKFSVFLEKQIGLKLKINFLFFEKSEKTENKFDDVTELPLVKKTLEFFDGKLIDVVKK